MTVQGLAAKGPAQAGVWVEAKDKVKVEAGWVDHLQQGRAEIVCALNVEQQPLMLPDSHVMQ